MTKKEKPKQIPEKKKFDIKDWHAIVFIVAAVTIFFRDILTMKAFMWEDFLYYYYPIRNFAAVSLASGELPLWNPYTFNGMPFQADIQTAVFYIPNLILTLFVSNGQLHPYWVELFLILHYAVAGVCMYYLMRHLKIERISSLFAAFVYMFSGFMITHSFHQNIINHAAWLPLVFLLFKKAIDTKKIYLIMAGGLILGHTILSGTPQFTLYTLLFLLFYVIFVFFINLKQQGFKNSLYIFPVSASIIILSIAVAAIQLMPTLELSPQSARAEISYEKSIVGTFAPQQVITLLVPKFFGEHSAQTNNFWGQGSYWQYWETNFYIGIAGLLFTLFAFSIIHKNKFVLFFSLTLLFSILYALGDHFILHKFFFHNIPGFHLFRNPGRMSLWFTFSAAILSGFGLQEIIKSSNRKLLTKISIIALLTGAVVWISVQLGLFQEHPNQQFLQEIRHIASSQSNIMMVFIAFVSIAIFIFSRSKISALTFAVLIYLIQFVDIHIFGFEFNNGKVSPTEYYKRTEQLVNFLKAKGEKEYFRTNSRQGGNMILDRNQGMVDKIFLMEGYTPLSLQRNFSIGKSWESICDLMNAKYRIQVNEKQGSMSIMQSDTYLPRAFLVYDYKVFNNEDTLKEFLISDGFDPRQIAALEVDPKLESREQNDISMWKAKITDYKINTISIDVYTPNDGLLVLSEIFYPGWKAHIDGAEVKILRANWNLRAIKVHKGENKVDVKFEPDSFHYGMIISAFTLGICILGIIFSLKKKGAN